MSEQKRREMSGAPPPPPSRAAPSPPGRSLRTQPRLSASLASLQDHSFDASWKRAKDKALKRVFDLPPFGDAIKLPLDKTFLSKNIKKKNEINYEKFGEKRMYHRARHNLKIAHDFFPFFYEELKKQIELTLNPKIDLMALVGEQGSSISDAHNTARMYAKQTGEAQYQKKKAEEEAEDARKEANDAIGITREARQKQEKQTLRLSELQTETHVKNVELTEENKELKMQLTGMKKQQLKLNEENVRLMDENKKLDIANREMGLRGYRGKKPPRGLLDREVATPVAVGTGSVGDSSAAAPKTRGRKQGWGWRRKTSSNPKSEGTKGGKRKRTRKKCNNRRLKKKMLCVRGTKRRLKKLKKHTKRLKLKLTRCSKKRLAKNFSVRKKRKYTRRK